MGNAVAGAQAEESQAPSTAQHRPSRRLASDAPLGRSREAVPADAQLPTPLAYLQGGSATSHLPMSNAAPAGEAANGANQRTDNKQFLSWCVCDGMESRVGRVCVCVCVCVRACARACVRVFSCVRW